MRIARVSVPDLPGPVFGVVNGTQIGLLKGHPFGELDPAGVALDLDDVKIMEKVGHDNLLLAQAWSVLEGQFDARGITLPKPGTTFSAPAGRP